MSFYTASNILQTYLELRELAPNLTEWSNEQFSDNPPRLYRLQQLNSLFQAFDIDCGVQAFVKGEFIRSGGPYYAALMEHIESVCPGRSIDEKHLRGAFRSLLSFREQLQDFLPSGYLEGMDLSVWAAGLAWEWCEHIRDHVPAFDSKLLTFIDPVDRKIPHSTLVHEFGFLDVDIDEIDFDWA